MNLIPLLFIAPLALASEASAADSDIHESTVVEEILALGGRVAFDEAGNVTEVEFYETSRRTATDRDLARLAELPKLKSLIIVSSQITDAGLVHGQRAFLGKVQRMGRLALCL